MSFWSNSTQLSLNNLIFSVVFRQLLLTEWNFLHFLNELDLNSELKLLPILTIYFWSNVVCSCEKFEIICSSPSMQASKVLSLICINQNILEDLSRNIIKKQLNILILLRYSFRVWYCVNLHYFEGTKDM